MSNLDFDHLILTFQEELLLRRSKKHPVHVRCIPRLIKNKLVEEERFHVPGQMGIPSGFASITDLGIDYLRFISHRRRTNYAIPVIVTILSNIAIHALSQLLPLIKEWLSALHA